MSYQQLYSEISPLCVCGGLGDGVQTRFWGKRIEKYSPIWLPHVSEVCTTLLAVFWCLFVCVCVCAQAALARAKTRWDLCFPSLSPSCRLCVAWTSSSPLWCWPNIPGMTWKQCQVCHWWHRSDAPGQSCLWVLAFYTICEPFCWTDQISQHPCHTPAYGRRPGPPLAHGESVCPRPTPCQNRENLRSLPQPQLCNKTVCRVCNASLAGAYTLLPCQWPPLGVPHQVLSLYDTSDLQSTAGERTNTTPPAPAFTSGEDVLMQTDMPHQAVSANDTHLGQLSSSQLKAEMAKMERGLQDSILAAEDSALLDALANLTCQQTPGRATTGSSFGQREKCQTGPASCRKAC